MEAGASVADLVADTGDAAKTGNQPLVLSEEVAKHCSKDSVWVALFGKVYDLTDFLQHHPGGAQVILAAAGKDVTAFWKAVHKAEWLKEHIRPDWCLGDLSTPEGMAPLVEHQFEKPRAAVQEGEVTFSPLEDYKTLKKRMQRRKPINVGYTLAIVDLLNRIQSGQGSQEVQVERMVSLVEERGDPNCTDQDGGGGSTPLLVAATIGSQEHIQRLLSAKADPLYKTERGATALHRFAARPLPDARASGVLTELLEAQCSMNAQMMQGRTPLHVAAQWGQADMCRMLVDKGALPRARAGKDGTPAEWASVCVQDKHRLTAVHRVLTGR